MNVTIYLPPMICHDNCLTAHHIANHPEKNNQQLDSVEIFWENPALLCLSNFSPPTIVKG